MIVVAIIGILAAIAIPLYANVQARARIAKAQADSRALASAVSIYAAHMGTVPAAGALSVLTVVAVNQQSQSAGPFMAQVPAPRPIGRPTRTPPTRRPEPSTSQRRVTTSPSRCRNGSTSHRAREGAPFPCARLCP